jgi:hypothetical protein
MFLNHCVQSGRPRSYKRSSGRRRDANPRRLRAIRSGCPRSLADGGSRTLALRLEKSSGTRLRRQSRLDALSPSYEKLHASAQCWRYPLAGAYLNHSSHMVGRPWPNRVGIASHKGRSRRGRPVGHGARAVQQLRPRVSGRSVMTVRELCSTGNT